MATHQTKIESALKRLRAASNGVDYKYDLEAVLRSSFEALVDANKLLNIRTTIDTVNHLLDSVEAMSGYNMTINIVQERKRRLRYSHITLMVLYRDLPAYKRFNNTIIETKATVVFVGPAIMMEMPFGAGDHTLMVPRDDIETVTEDEQKGFGKVLAILGT